VIHKLFGQLFVSSKTSCVGQSYEIAWLFLVGDIKEETKDTQSKASRHSA